MAQQGQKGGNRPGAMTQAMQAVAPVGGGPKVLRIGLIQSGKIVEERVIRSRETVSIGTSEKNHFIIHDSKLAARFDLFQRVGNDYILNFTETMKGRVGLPGGVQELAQLRSGGAARNAGTHWQVKLSDTSRGKIVVGDVTLLFQFVVPPPVTPRPQLPAAAQGGLVKGIDWMFTAFVVFSYMLFFGFVIYLENADWPINEGLAEIPENMARFLFEEEEAPPEPEETTEESDEGEEPTEETTEVVKPSKKRADNSESSSNSNSNDAQAARAEAAARIGQEAQAQAEAMLLGALGSDGALADVLNGGAVTGNAEDVLAQANGVDVASKGAGSTLRTRSGGGGSGQAGSLGSLRGGNGGGKATSEGGAVKERVVRGRIKLGGGGGDIGGSGDFDASQVVKQIKKRLRAIQNCYERELRNNPSLAGKVTVKFTIVERGTVSKATAATNTTGSPKVGACVVTAVKRFRFNPGPEGGSVTYSYPFVFQPQN